MEIDKSKTLHKCYDISVSTRPIVSRFTEYEKVMNAMEDENFLPIRIVEEAETHISIEEEIMPYNFDDKMMGYGKFEFENFLKTMVKVIYKFNGYFNRNFNLKTTNILFSDTKKMYFTDNFCSILDEESIIENPLTEIFCLLKEIKIKYFNKLKDNDQKILDTILLLENKENMILDDFLLEIECIFIISLFFSLSFLFTFYIDAITLAKNQNESDSFFAELLAEYNDEYKEYLNDNKVLGLLKDNSIEFYYSDIHKLESGKSIYIYIFF